MNELIFDRSHDQLILDLSDDELILQWSFSWNPPSGPGSLHGSLYSPPTRQQLPKAVRLSRDAQVGGSLSRKSM